MVIVVTGAIGIGKTTVCRKLIGIVRNQGYTCGGILTYKAADKGIIIEDIQSGEKEALASINNVYYGPRTAKYFFNPKGIDFGIKAVNAGASATILLIDEIGHLEVSGGGFANVLKLIKGGRIENCILVVCRGLLLTFQPRLGTMPLVFETTINNRNQLPQEIGSVLLEKLRLIKQRKVNSWQC